MKIKSVSQFRRGPHIEGSALLPPMHGGEGLTLCPSASHCEGVFPWIERAGISAGQERRYDRTESNTRWNNKTPRRGTGQ